MWSLAGEAAAGDGKPLTLNGVVYAKGFGVHSSSDLVYSLQNTKGASCGTFTASVGVDDEVGSNGSVVFQVLTGASAASASVVYDSGRLTGSSATKNISLSVTGAKVLILRVTDAGDGKNFDHADWGTPNVTCTAAATPAAGSKDAGFTPNSFRGNVAFTAVTPEGKIVGAGDAPLLQRLDQDGQPDRAFAQNAAPFTVNKVLGLVAQPDGRLLLLGRGSSATAPTAGVTPSDFLFVQRLNADGQPDASFGNSRFPGFTVLNETAQVSAFVRQPGGQVVIAGTDCDTAISNDVNFPGQKVCVPFLRRLQANGQPDLSFGAAGRVIQNSATVASTLTALAVKPDGQLLLSELALSSSARVVLRNYSRDGAESFKVSVFDSGFQNVGVDAIATTPAGKILLAGRLPTEVYQQGGVACVLSQLNADGTVDGSYNYAAGPRNSRLTRDRASLAVQPNGQAVLGGCFAAQDQAGGSAPTYTDLGQALFRFNVDGSQDLSFGKVLGQVGNTPIVGAPVSGSQSVLIQPANVGGKVVSGLTTITRVWP